MKNVIAGLLISALLINVVGAMCLAGSGLVWAGLTYPQYGVPGLIFVWVMLAWLVVAKVPELF